MIIESLVGSFRTRGLGLGLENIHNKGPGPVSLDYKSNLIDQHLTLLNIKHPTSFMQELFVGLAY